MVQGKSCRNCKHSRSLNKVIDCLNPEVEYQLLDKYKKNPRVIPEFCENYEAEMVVKCSCCNESINHPVYTWKYWVEDIFENLAVCSRRCQEKLQANLDKGVANFNMDFEEEDNNDNSETDYPF